MKFKTISFPNTVPNNTPILLHDAMSALFFLLKFFLYASMLQLRGVEGHKEILPVIPLHNAAHWRAPNRLSVTVYGPCKLCPWGDSTATKDMENTKHNMLTSTHRVERNTLSPSSSHWYIYNEKKNIVAHIQDTNNRFSSFKSWTVTLTGRPSFEINSHSSLAAGTIYTINSGYYSNIEFKNNNLQFTQEAHSEPITLASSAYNWLSFFENYETHLPDTSNHHLPFQNEDIYLLNQIFLTIQSKGLYKKK